MAVNAALTGHLVISTVHTNSAVQAVTRLLNMGVKPFMLAASLNMIIGQRLLRKVAKPRTIKTPADIDADIQASLAQIKTFYPKMHINYDHMITQPDKRTESIHEGYKGRVAVFEMLNVSPAIKDAILRNAATTEILSLARDGGSP